MKPNIEVGDIVEVSISDGVGTFTGCVILYLPNAPGDSWHLRHTGTDSYLIVQNFLYMRRTQERQAVQENT